MAATSTKRATTRRPAPEPSTEFAHLSLPALRAYRTELTTEESRVSYWRRLVQTRLDVVLAGTGKLRGHSGADRDKLHELLTDERVASRRNALVAVLPTDDVPPLPDLAGLWAEQPEDDYDDARTELMTRLAAAENELSAYRTALHRRIDRTTSELIARSREDPITCLVALPLRRR